MKDGYLSKAVLAETFGSQVEIDRDWCENLHYGLGFFVQQSSEGKPQSYYLVGGDPGVSFSSHYYLGVDRIVSILGNTSDGADKLRAEILPYLI